MTTNSRVANEVRHAVLIVGSGLSIRLLNEIETSSWIVVCLNRAWKFKPKAVDYLVHMPALPGSARPRPSELGPDRIISAKECVAAAAYYAARLPGAPSTDPLTVTGDEIHFYASYWAMQHLKARVLGYLGCDLDYQGNQTHFYGRGQPVPWSDRSREPLDVYFDRQRRICEAEGVALLNLSDNPRTRLPYPRESGT